MILISMSVLLGVALIVLTELPILIERFDSTIVTNAWSALLSGNTMYLAGGGQRKLIGYNSNNGQWIIPGFLDPYYDNADIVTLMYRDSHGDEWYSINHGGGLVRKIAKDKSLEHYSKNLASPFFYAGLCGRCNRRYKWQ